MKKLVLVDGYSFLFRAYFAVKSNLKRADGTPVGALYGFIRMLMKVISELEPTHLAVVFDCGKKTFRSEIATDYKANRPPAPQDLIPQFSLVREAVKSLNIISLEKEGYEADDIIATIVKKSNDFDEVFIVSSDKDLMQLIHDNIYLFDGIKHEKIDKNKVIERWGVEPEKLLDLLSLIGDNADNVKGIPGIGPKTAADLLNKYGSLDNIYDNINDIKQNSRRENIKNNRDIVLLAKRLITLFDEVPLECTTDDLAVKNVDTKNFKDFLEQQNFYSIKEKIKDTNEICINDLKRIFEYSFVMDKKAPKKVETSENLLEFLSEEKEKNEILEKKIETIEEFRKIIDLNNSKELYFYEENSNLYLMENENIISIDVILEDLDLFSIGKKGININDIFNIMIKNDIASITFDITDKCKNNKCVVDLADIYKNIKEKISEDTIKTKYSDLMQELSNIDNIKSKKEKLSSIKKISDSLKKLAKEEKLDEKTFEKYKFFLLTK